MINRIEKLKAVNTIYKSGDEYLARAGLESQAKINELIDHLNKTDELRDRDFMRLSARICNGNAGLYELINKLQAEIDDLKLGCGPGGILHKEVEKLKEGLQDAKNDIFTGAKHEEERYERLDRRIDGLNGTVNAKASEAVKGVKTLHGLVFGLAVKDLTAGCWYLITEGVLPCRSKFIGKFSCCTEFKSLDFTNVLHIEGINGAEHEYGYRVFEGRVLDIIKLA